MKTSNQDPNRRGADSMSEPSGNGATKQKFKEDVQDAKHEVGARAREKAEAGQHRVADEANTLSDAIDAAASSLDDDDREGLARYARELSSSLASAAGQLEGRSVDELAKDAKRLARNNPAMFMLGSIAVGFGLSRFFKASAKHDHQGDQKAFRTEAQLSDDIFGDDDFATDASVHPREQDLTATNPSPATPHNGDGRNTP